MDARPRFGSASCNRSRLQTMNAETAVAATYKYIWSNYATNDNRSKPSIHVLPSTSAMTGRHVWMLLVANLTTTAVSAITEMCSDAFIGKIASTRMKDHLSFSVRRVLPLVGGSYSKVLSFYQCGAKKKKKEKNVLFRSFSQSFPTYFYS